MTELQKAIKWLEEMEKQNRLWELYLKKPESSEYGDNAANCRALLDALRKEPCGWCKHDEYIQRLMDEMQSSKVYCPNCGRPLPAPPEGSKT